MISPPIFTLIAAAAPVTALLGTNPVRFWLFGEGEPNPVLPYAVWQTTNGTPENYLGNRPDIDSWSLQLDVYAAQAQNARNVAQAIRDAIEGSAYVTGYNGEFRDPVTRVYRYSMSVDFWTNR